jgi:dephospho-CoA kinase
MIAIGLTGGVACGKSTVARMLADFHGARVVDADQVARRVVEPGEPAYSKIRDAFGPGVFGPDGALDRKALGNIVFADPDTKRRLESITHPAIRDRIAAQLVAWGDAGVAMAVVEAALLVETGSYRHYPELVVITCTPDVQLQRLMQREGLSETEAGRIIASQMPIAEKEAFATVVIANNGDLESLRVSVNEAWGTITQRWE